MNLATISVAAPVSCHRRLAKEGDCAAAAPAGSAQLLASAAQAPVAPACSPATDEDATISGIEMWSADLLAESAQKDGIELTGPVTKIQDVSWQAREQTGYDISQFQIDWEAKQVTSPNGATSVRWQENRQDRTGNAVIHVAFPTSICRACCARDLCTRSKQQGRTMQLRPQAQHEALQRARAEQHSAEFKRRYRPRFDSEPTHLFRVGAPPIPPRFDPLNEYAILPVNDHPRRTAIDIVAGHDIQHHT